MKFINIFKHLHTINSHRRLVRKLCFKCGMYKQGLLHDLSKYSFAEFWPSVENYQGYRSPISKEKEIKGYSECWLHHKGRNKHHWEYWCDQLLFNYENNNITMPDKYLLESICDKISASKIYTKDKYTTDYPYNFFLKSKEINLMSKANSIRYEHLLKYLKDNGEEKALKYYKSLYKEIKKNGKINWEEKNVTW